MQDYWKLLVLIMRHKWFVFIFARRIGGVPLWRLVVHDMSKFLPSEIQSCMRLYIRKEKIGEWWEKTRLLHVRRNPHHWEHWVDGDIVRPMPEDYVREMLADWLSSARVYRKNGTVEGWLKFNSHTLILHPETLEILKRVLAENEIIWPSS